ncbi:hypothetical protein [Galactobacter valiniphilus]|uniref:hypothetical protein n=1 Tax=Galactobacter valiniphilus TaxID=2676122 RepID=UPI0013143C2C|nr:hypothetical protein [Galactobacter valiniphilus]
MTDPGPAEPGKAADSRGRAEYDAAWRLVRSAVLAACSPWVSAGLAVVEERGPDHEFGPELEITPSSGTAAQITVSLADEEEASLTCGGVFFWVWRGTPEELAGSVAEVVRDVAEHGMVAAGAAARILTGEDSYGVGLSSFVPWRWRRGKRVFTPYR